MSNNQKNKNIMKTKNETYLRIQKEISDEKIRGIHLCRIGIMIVLDLLVIFIWGDRLFDIIFDTFLLYMNFDMASTLVPAICIFSFGTTLILVIILPLFSSIKVSEIEIIERAKEQLEEAEKYMKEIKDLEEIVY